MLMFDATIAMFLMVLGAGSIAVAVILYLTVLPNAFSRRKSTYEPMEFSEVRKTTVYSDHIEKGEL